MSVRSQQSRAYGRPLALAVLSAFGLIAALLADGIWDALSWIALSVPVALIAWHARPRRRHL